MKDAGKKIGVFLCKCGTNIAGAVDTDALAKWVEGQPDIAWVRENELLCAPAGKTFIKETLESNPCDSVVIAACSPKMHENNFRNVAAEKNMNMAQVNMVNIREQAAWVTPDGAEALRKAQALISAGLQRAQFNEDLVKPEMECKTDVAIIGGGIAGIEAALMLANAGRHVTMFEKEISIGGSVIKTEEVAPAMECAPCLLAPRLAEVRDHGNIDVVSGAEVTDVLGFFGNFTVKALQRARFITSACIGCEACFEGCPVSVPSTFHLGMGNRKAVYNAFAGSVPAAAVIDKEHCRRFNGEECTLCKEACPFGAVDYDDSDKVVEVETGAVILATGAGEPDISRLFGGVVGQDAGVLTMPQFERLAASNGPTGGEITGRDGTVPQSLAVVHCAGSLRDDGLSYCSGICCMTALKAGELFRKKVPEGKVYNIYDRLTLSGVEQHRFFERQREEGTAMIKTSDLSSVTIERKEGKLQVSAAGMDTPVTVDMVVLSTGMAPTASAERLVELTAADLDKSGFFKPGHPILQTAATTIDGVYGAGACMSPCDVPTAIIRGQAAAGDVLSRLVPGRKLELESMTACIDGELCAGCKMCIAVCPYKAISFDAEKGISIVNEAICRGCGTCAATCPGKAASARHFTNQQIEAELKGVLNG